MKSIKRYDYKPIKGERILMVISLLFGEIATVLAAFKFDLSGGIWFLIAIVVFVIIAIIVGMGKHELEDEINKRILSVYECGYNAGYIDGKNGDEKEKDIIMV